MKSKQNRLDSSLVLEFVAKKKSFTTDDVMKKFRVGRRQAGAAIAILRIKEVVEPDEPAKVDGTSCWTYTG